MLDLGADADAVRGAVTDRPNTTFEVSASGDRTCPGCGQTWKVSYDVSWEPRDATPPR